MSNVKVTVKSVKGSCAAGYKEGDYFLIEDGLMVVPCQPEGLCMYALPALLPGEAAWVEHVKIIDVPATTGGRRLELIMSGDEARAVAFLA